MTSTCTSLIHRPLLTMNRQQITTKGRSQTGVSMFWHNLLWFYWSIPSHFSYISFSVVCLLNWLFSCQSNCSAANKCLLKVATYAAQLEQYQKAIEIYEQVCIKLPINCYSGLSQLPFFMSLFLVMLRLEHMQWTASCWSMALKTTSSKQLFVTSVWTCLMQGWVFVFLIPTHRHFASM